MKKPIKKGTTITTPPLAPGELLLAAAEQNDADGNKAVGDYYRRMAAQARKRGAKKR